MRRALATVLLALPWACTVTIDDTKADAVDAGPDASLDAGADAKADARDAGACDGKVRAPARQDGGACPADMAKIATSGGSFCIDLREASVGDYRAFLEQKAAGCPILPTECAWNVDFTPDGWTGTTPDRPSNLPVIGVTWCDAWAFCQWQGKRLCGKIGGGEVPYDYPGFADPNVSEWFRACSNLGTTSFPYGNVYDANKCVGADYDASAKPLAVDAPASCVATVAPLLDMSGNVSEWEAACGGRDEAKCDGGHECDFCHVRGGSYSFAGTKIGCADGDNDPRKQKDIEIGIRCCAD